MTAPHWLIAIALTLAIGWFAAWADIPAELPSAAQQAAQEEAAALASRDWAASKACNGRPFEWLDDKTLVCHREVPASTAARGAL